MSNLAPYQAAKDQIKTKHWSNQYDYTGKEDPYQQSSHSKPYNQRFSNGGDQRSSSNGSRITATICSPDDYGRSIRTDQRLVYPDTYTTNSSNRAFEHQERITMEDETRQDDSITSTPLMIMPIVLTTRQIENKTLEDNHKNINKKLDDRAQAAKIAAQRTRVLIHHFKLVKKTESTRLKKEKACDNVRYLDTVDGMVHQAEIKLEQKARKQAVSLLYNQDYSFNRRAGLAMFSTGEMFSKHRTSSTKLGPFV